MRNHIARTLLICVMLSGVVLSFSMIEKKFRTTPVILKYPPYFGNRTFIPTDNPTTEEGVQLGRMLFYEPKLSANNTVSCAFCHKQEFAFADGKSFSGGVDGTLTDRSSMSLANLLWSRSFFWDGRVNGLEQQAEAPLTNEHEMGQTLEISAKKLVATNQYAPYFEKAFGSPEISGDRILKALAQFERTLISANSQYDQYLSGKYKPNASELNGMKLFFTTPDPERNIRGATCGRCHAGEKTYGELFHNNGLDSIPEDNGREKFTGQRIDRGRFKAVSLRNIALTAPYMHDGRLRTLEEVVDHYNGQVSESETLSTFLRNNSNDKNGIKLALTATEKKDIVAFLHMLTDSSFIKDKRFSNPFK